MIKNNACVECSKVIAQRRQSINRPARESKADLPVEKETRNPRCDHYGECLTRAALANGRIVGCNDCDREAYTPGTLGVFPVIDPGERYALSSGLWREIKQGGG